MVNLGELIVEEKETEIDGKKIKYLDCYVIVEDTKVRFVPKIEDKSLLKFMIR